MRWVQLPLVISDEAVRNAVDVPFVLDAVEAGFRVQAAGGALPPSRIDVPVATGWLRVMAISVPAWGVYGVKLMNLTAGVGLRYVIALYEQESGRLLALIDARTVTAMRTAAAAALAARCLADEDVDTLAIIGTGNEARRLLQAMLHVRPVAAVRVYSRNDTNRRRFVEEARNTYPARFTACAGIEEAVAGVGLIALATKSPTPVLSAASLAPRCHISSIGASRQDQSELAADVLGRADPLVCDSVTQVFAEAGDVRSAVEQGLLDPARAVELSDVLAGREVGGGTGWSVYKSVGTALQDVALAFPLLRRVQESGAGLEIGDFPMTKPFT